MTRWGATPAEWTAFVMLGLTEHLLPVVSNPNAKISPLSQLKSLGKTPSRYDANRQVVGIAKWTSIKATDAQIHFWSQEVDYGIALQTRDVRAIDIDLEDAEAVGKIRRAAFEHFGVLPVRTRAGSFRLLICFRLRGAWSKRIARVLGGIIEFLADGQQFVAAGTHPSGARYTWEGGLPDDIPEITAEQFEAFWQDIGGSRPREDGRAERGGNSAGGGGTQSVRADDPVAAWLESEGWLREYGREGELFIHCPWAVDHTGDSGPSETAYYPAGTGGYAQGHFKCLHAHCCERTDEDFLTAVGFNRSVAGDFEVIESRASPAVGGGLSAGRGAVVTGESPRRPARLIGRDAPAAWNSAVPGEALRRGKKGYLAELENVARALATDGFWRRVGYDTFRQGLVSCSWADALGEEQWAPLSGHQMIEARELLGHCGFEPVGRELCRDALELVARRCSFNSAQQWLNSLQWDGTPRIEGFCATYWGSADTAYSRAVGLYLWTALAGRVLQPGCRAQMVPILVGEQGVKKTTGLAALVPVTDWYVTIDLAARDADLARRMRGRLVWEINELRGLHTRERGAINTFITEAADTWTPKYEEFAVTVPRQGLFIGTTNDEEFLDDETGNRRWLPLRVGLVALERIEADRGQLWAEAAARWAVEGVAWAAAEGLAKAEHDEFRMVDDMEFAAQKWLARQPEEFEFTSDDLLLGVGMDPRMATRATYMRVAKCLKKLSYSKHRSEKWDVEGDRRVRLQFRFWRKINALA